MLLANEDIKNQISLEHVITIRRGIPAIQRLNSICNEKHPKILESLLEHLGREANSTPLAIPKEKLKVLFSAFLLNRVIDALNTQTRNLQSWNLDMEFNGIKIIVKELSKEHKVEIKIEYKQKALTDSVPSRSFNYEDGELSFTDSVRNAIASIIENFDERKLGNAVKQLSMGQEHRLREHL